MKGAVAKVTLTTLLAILQTALSVYLLANEVQTCGKETLAFVSVVWSHVSVHLMHGSPTFILLSALNWSPPTGGVILISTIF